MIDAISKQRWKYAAYLNWIFQTILCYAKLKRFCFLLNTYACCCIFFSTLKQRFSSGNICKGICVQLHSIVIALLFAVFFHAANNTENQILVLIFKFHMVLPLMCVFSIKFKRKPTFFFLIWFIAVSSMLLLTSSEMKVKKSRA